MLRMQLKHVFEQINNCMPPPLSFNISHEAFFVVVIVLCVIHCIENIDYVRYHCHLLLGVTLYMAKVNISVIFGIL